MVPMNISFLFLYKTWVSLPYLILIAITPTFSIKRSHNGSATTHHSTKYIHLQWLKEDDNTLFNPQHNGKKHDYSTKGKKSRSLFSEISSHNAALWKKKIFEYSLWVNTGFVSFKSKALAIKPLLLGPITLGPIGLCWIIDLLFMGCRYQSSEGVCLGGV